MVRFAGLLALLCASTAALAQGSRRSTLNRLKLPRATTGLQDIVGVLSSALSFSLSPIAYPR